MLTLNLLKPCVHNITAYCTNSVWSQIYAIYAYIWLKYMLTLSRNKKITRYETLTKLLDSREEYLHSFVFYLCVIPYKYISVFIILCSLLILLVDVNGLINSSACTSLTPEPEFEQPNSLPPQVRTNWQRKLFFRILQI